MLVSELATGVTELNEKIKKTSPEIIIICLAENDQKVLEIIPKILKISPETKIILLTNPNVLKNPSEVEKAGVAGLVGMNQNISVLIRAIEEVSQGKNWLNQNFASKLFKKDGLNDSNGHQNSNDGELLTRREMEVLMMIGTGMNNKQIAKNMFISEATVRHHLSSIYDKMQVNDRLNLVIYAYQIGILEVPDEIY